MWETRGNEIQTAVEEGGRRGGGVGVQTAEGQKVCVLCVKISVQVRGEVCMLRRVEFHTSHLTHIPTCHRV